MKYLVFAVMILMVGYVVAHRPRSSGVPHRESSRFAAREVEDLRDELAAKEQLLATIKNAMATGNVPKCSRAGKVTFTEEAYATVRDLEAEVAALRDEVGRRGR